MSDDQSRLWNKIEFTKSHSLEVASDLKKIIFLVVMISIIVITVFALELTTSIRRTRGI